MEQKLVYFNDPQRLTQLIGARTSVVVAGRRTGKTDSIAAPFMLRNMQRMPGSVGGIVVPTFRHGLTATLPGSLAAWERWGYHSGIHYVVGKQPPSWFAKDRAVEIRDWSRAVALYNGSVAVLLSQDCAISSNSLTLSWLLVDEGRFVDYRKLHQETLPALGGIKSRFASRSCFNSMMVLSDMPQSTRGSWILNYREKSDPLVIEAIGGLVAEIYALKAKAKEYISSGSVVPPYLGQRLRQLDRWLNQLRSVAVFYKEYSSIENIQLLGEDYIRRMKRDLTPKTFQTSILCQRLGLQKDGFYSSMTEDHIYDASDMDFLSSVWDNTDWGHVAPQSLVNDRGSRFFTSAADADIDPDSPISIGMDYNANINWIVAGQPRGEKLLVLKSFYSKYERKIPELVDDFCFYYQGHRNKTVIYYYDATALRSNFAVNDYDFHQAVCDSFARHGWHVVNVYLGRPMYHREKYLLINNGFAGRQRLEPLFNRQNNDDLLIGIQSAGVKMGRNGFEKDKDGEKIPETEEDLLQHRTDGTDAFDTLYIGAERYPFSPFNTYDEISIY